MRAGVVEARMIAQVCDRGSRMDGGSMSDETHWYNLEFEDALHDPSWERLGIQLRFISAGIAHEDGTVEACGVLVDERAGERSRRKALTHRQFALLLAELSRFYEGITEEDLQAMNEGGIYQPLIQGARRRAKPQPRPPRPKVAGWVYILNSSVGYYKIGRARILDARITQLQIQLPFKVTLEHAIESDDHEWAEQTIHERFADRRMNGEWFALTEADIAWLKGHAHLDAPPGP